MLPEGCQCGFQLQQVPRTLSSVGSFAERLLSKKMGKGAVYFRVSIIWFSAN